MLEDINLDPQFTPEHSPSGDGIGNQAENTTPETRHGREVPRKLAEYWNENVPEELKRFLIPSDKIFQGGCLTPDPDHTRRMYARSKCMRLLHPSDTNILSDPTRSIPMCFVQKTGAELPLHIQMCIYLFTSLLNHVTPDITHFSAPSATVGVQYDHTDPRVIRGLVSTGEGLPGAADNVPGSEVTEDDFININDILASRDMDQECDSIHVPVAPISMHIGFTGAVFEVDGEEKREVFCVLMVTPAANFAMMSYMHGKFLLRPKQGCQKYEQLLELHIEASGFFKEIMRYEIYENLGVDERRFRTPEDYQQMAGASLGHSTVLSPFQIPFKIYNQIRKEYPGVNPASIRIIGMPEMNFRGSDQITTDFLHYMEKSINCDQRRQTALSEGIRKYDLSKDKENLDAMNLSCVGGWPLEVDHNMEVRAFGLPPLPLIHSFDPQGARGTFAVFTASIGDADKSLPDYTRLLLTGFLVHSSPVDERPRIEHMLKDKRIANPLECLRKYFGSEADPFSALIITNRNRVWLDAVMMDIKDRRERGVSIPTAVTVIADYLRSSVRNLRSMITCKVFRSNTVFQMLTLHDQTDWMDVCVHAKDSIRNTMRSKSAHMSILRRADPFARSWNLFMRLWEDMNRFFFLNAGNLVCAVEIMLSQLMFKFAHTNDTWTFFYATVQVMSGNGHFQVHTPDGPMPDRKKKNTSGMDFTLARLADIWDAFYERYMIPKKDRFHKTKNCMRFTPTVWENLVCATAMGGRILTVPPPNCNFQFMSITEMRDSLKPLILFGLARGEEGNVQTYNSAEQSDKSRVTTVKEKLYNNNIGVVASNKQTKDKEEGEEGWTIDAVSAILPSGVAPPAMKKRKTTFASSDSSTNTARHQMLDGRYKGAVVNCIAFSQNFAGLFVGLLNHIGAMTIECNRTSLAFYDFLCHYTRQFLGGGMDAAALEAFSRMKEGYKSRGVIQALWLKVLYVMALGKSPDESIRQIWLDIHTDALPVTSIPSVCCTLIYRSIHMGCLLMIATMARVLEVPFIDWKHLNRFFEDSRKPAADDPDVAYIDDYKAIKQFIQRCIQNHQFCPAEEGQFSTQDNISCYITSPGTDTQTPATRNSIMRYIPGRKDEDGDLTSRLAERIFSTHGRLLNSECHMGPEKHVYMYALRTLLERFSPDLRGLISHKMFCTRQHLEGLELLRFAEGVQDYEESDSMPFAKQFNFRVGNELRSSAIGLNVWSLLAMVSLMEGAEIHPNVSNTVANNFMKYLLEFTPPGSTPGNICPVRCFHVHTTAPVKLFISDKGRPNHFWRPEDASFVLTGSLPIAQAIGEWMPEDLLPNPSIWDVGTRDLACGVMDVPATAFTTPPNLMPDTYYSYHIPKFSDTPHESEGDYGTIIIITSAATVELSRYDKNKEAKEPQTLELDEWDEYLRNHHMVVTPLITRGGACVRLELEEGRKTLGCLIQYPEFQSQFNPDTCSYQALMTPEMDVAQIFFTDLLRHCMVPIGEIMYLNMEILPEAGFRAQGADGKKLHTRLAPPNVRDPEEGKIYVTALYQPLNRRGSTEVSASAITFAVNPWDVQLASEYDGDLSKIVKKLR